MTDRTAEQQIPDENLTGLVLVQVEETTIVPPHMVAKARRGRELKAIISRAKKDLEAIDDEFKDFFEVHGVREAHDAKHNVVAVLNHRSAVIFHPREFKEQHPDLHAEFCWPNETDSVAYPPREA
jgi:hypothetical protein